MSHLDAVAVRAQRVVDAPQAWWRPTPKLMDARTDARHATDLLKGSPTAPQWAIDGFSELAAVLADVEGSRAQRIAGAKRALEQVDHLRGQLVERTRSVPMQRTLTQEQASQLGTAFTDSRARTEAGALQLGLLREMTDSADAGQVVRDRLTSYLQRDPDDLSIGEWRHIHDLYSMPHTAEHLPPLPDPGPGYRPQLEIIDELAQEKLRPQGATRRTFVLAQEQLAGGPPSPEVAAEQVRAMVMDTSPRAMTGLDWARLQRLLEFAPAEVQPPRGSHDDAIPIRKIMRGLVESDMVASTGTSRQVDRWRAKLDPTYPERRARQIADGVLEGRLEPGLGPDDVLPTEAFWQHLDVDDETRASLQLRAQLLAWGNEVPATRVHTGQVLDGIAPLLDEIDATDETVVELLEQSRKLIADNRARLKGDALPSGEIRGYGKHPDYAQVGRLTQNSKLLARIAWPDLPGLPTQPRQQAAQVGEALAW